MNYKTKCATRKNKLKKGGGNKNPLSAIAQRGSIKIS
jgi:hypothetical protein